RQLPRRAFRQRARAAAVRPAAAAPDGAVPRGDQGALKDLTEHFVSGELVFDGHLLKVHRDTVRLPDGSQGSREYIRHPGAVAILALTEDRQLLLERQYRYPPKREFIEIPA